MPDFIDNSSPTMIVYSASLSRRLAAGRFPPTYLGLVRRVRPSNQSVKSALVQGGSLDVTLSESNGAAAGVPHNGISVVYKVVGEDGVERRMTNTEKKQRRLEAAKRKKELKKQERQSNLKESHLKKELANNDRYFQLDVDSKLMADELAEIKGLRDGVPPVALAPACALQAARQGMLPGLSPSQSKVVFDENLSSQWASLLKQSMASAEGVRAAESMRPMPYQLNPEAWSRMRPDFLVANGSKHSSTASDEAWSPGHFQPAQCRPMYNVTANAVVELLYHANALEVSCGAKFGSDFLLYQGPRENCHAFAGLRIECSRSLEDLAVPTAYDLSGFVRGLNTAAKLSLLATVVFDRELCRVALVDLALEKVVAMGRNKRAGPDIEKLQKKR